jgi:hypothetical protein
MSTTNLILIAIFICLLCLGSLWLAQVKRQRAIERARKTVIYNAQIIQVQQIAEATAQFLDDKLIQFLANRIIHSGLILNKNNIAPDKRSRHIIEQANEWLQEPKLLRKQSRKGKPESHQKRLTLLKTIIQHIRQAVLDREVSRPEAKKLANSAKLGKIKLACNHYQQDADQSLKEGDLQQAINHLKKIKKTLAQVSPLSHELKQQVIECDTLIDSTQQTINSQNDNTSSQRLEDEFDKMKEQEEDWQKKQLYDQ